MVSSISCARRLIVGVDYGTTFSGVSYTWSDAEGIKDIETIREWAGRGVKDNTNRKKVPSRISYQGNHAWGYNIKPNQAASVYSWTKLLLDREGALTENDDESLKMMIPGLLQLPEGKSAEDVVTDYLTLLYNHIMQHLSIKNTESLVEITHIDFWFSIPAIWSDKAKLATRRAAQRAGFGSRDGDTISMIQEPEAAAIACLNELTKSSSSPVVKEGEGLIVCDCGGGTVDISSYKIIRGFPRLELHETAVTLGGKCGSTTIDRSLHRLLSERFGGAFDRIPAKRKCVGSNLMQAFEGVKQDFGYSEGMEYRLPLDINVKSNKFYERMEEEDDDVRGEVILTHDDMVRLFEPVVTKIKSLLDEQIRITEEKGLAIKTIILAGGLGESRHLYNELYAWRRDNIGLLNPECSWEAICKGAALRGLEGSIVPVRKCPKNYGTEVCRPFREGLDQEEDSFICPFENMKKAEGYMTWLYTKGEDMSTDTYKSLRFRRTIHQGSKLEFTDTLYMSNMAIAPDKEAHRSVQKVGELKVDISGLDLSIFPSRNVSDGGFFGGLFSSKKTVYQIAYEIRVSVLSQETGVMEFKVVVQGQELGSLSLNIAEDPMWNGSFFH